MNDIARLQLLHCLSRFLQQVISFSLLVTRLGLGVTGAMCEEGPII